jgi:citrate synthase
MQLEVVTNSNHAARMPKTLHPMTQLSIAVAALNHDSAFSAAYERGIKKADYWHYALEDALKLIAKLPSLAARIFTNVYRDGQKQPIVNKELDLIGKHPCTL